MIKVRWGVLGCAAFARRRTIPAMLDTPSVDLVGVASRTAAKAESFRADFGLARAYSSYEAMLGAPDIQAVYVPLPNGLHAEWTIRAIQAGKHVLCEKPFASDAAAAQRVADTAAGGGVYVMEAFMWRFHPQHVRARALVAAGAIGPVRLVRGAFTFPMNRPGDVRLRRDLAGGCVMDVGCYPISAARYYFGAEPTRAYARGEFDPEAAIDMRMSGLLEFEAGRALIDSSFSLPFRGDLEIVGEKGVLYLPKAWLPDTEAAIVVDGQAESFPPCNQYVHEFAHMSECILEGRPPRYGPEDAIAQMHAIDAVRRSMETGRPEEVNYPFDGSTR